MRVQCTLSAQKCTLNACSLQAPCTLHARYVRWRWRCAMAACKYEVWFISASMILATFSFSDPNTWSLNFLIWCNVYVWVKTSHCGNINIPLTIPFKQWIFSLKRKIFMCLITYVLNQINLNSLNSCPIRCLSSDPVTSLCRSHIVSVKPAVVTNKLKLHLFYKWV